MNKSKGGETMSNLNLREFPDELHREAKAKAALMGISLKELIIRAVTEYLKNH
jgi:predicted HicB family RNase H-like nuclease